MRLLGFFGMPLGLFAPAPLAVLCVRHGEVPLLLASALAVAGLFGAAGPGAAAAFLFTVAVPAWAIGRGLKSAWAPELVVAGTAALLALSTYVALRLSLPDGIRPWVADLVAQTIDLYARQGVPEATVEMLRAREARFAEVFFHMLPLGLMASGIALGTASLLAARVWLVRGAPDGFRVFSPLDWHLPDPWIWGLIAAGLLMLVPHEGAKVAGANALGVMAIAYALQGWAVMAGVFRSRGVHWLVRVVFYALLVLWPVLVVALVLLGLTDVWTDLRRVRPAPVAPKD